MSDFEKYDARESVDVTWDTHTQEPETDRLRKLLDERGMFWIDIRRPHMSRTCFKSSEDAEGYCYFDESVFGVTNLNISNVTAEQVIQATLGRGTCHIITDGRGHWECDACGCDFGGHDSCDPNDPPACDYCPSCGAKVVSE